MFAVGEVGVLKCLNYLVTLGGVHPLKIVVLIMGIFVLPADPILFNWGCSHRDGGRLGRVSRSYKRYRADESILGCHQKHSKAAVLAPSKGSIH